MPELPEVETIRRSLTPLIINHTIDQLQVLHPAVWLNPHDLPLQGGRIVALRRRGKYLLFELDLNGEAAVLVVHLRMTGKLIHLIQAEAPAPHTHLRLTLRSPAGEISYLDYNDVRRFGRLQLLPADQLHTVSGLASLGPEPFPPDWSEAQLAAALQRYPGRPIKQLLLDQKIIAGLGNIYTDEVLFRAAIDPARRCADIQPAECSLLARLVSEVLTEAIGHRGTSFRDYVDGLGKQGHFQLSLKVYGRTGQACKVCGATIDRRLLAGRGTHSCPNCQH